MKGCGKEFHHKFWGDRICGRFEDLKHSDHFICCEECSQNLKTTDCVCGHDKEEHTKGGCCYFKKGLLDKDLKPAKGEDKFMCKCKKYSLNLNKTKGEQNV